MVESACMNEWIIVKREASWKKCITLKVVYILFKQFLKHEKEKYSNLSKPNKNEFYSR